MKSKIIWIVAIILSFFIGICATIIVIKYINSDQTITNKNVTVTEQDSISEAIEKVYDAVVVVEF